MVDMSGVPIRILFHSPRIPGNTGAAIRLSAGVGCELHLAGPMAFEFTDTHLKRAGLDYHDLAHVVLHDDLEAAYAALLPARVLAFSARANVRHTAISYQQRDVLLFGPEPTGLDEAVLADDRVSEQVRIPMLAGRRSMNLANAASVAVYEAWRQFDFVGAAD